MNPYWFDSLPIEKKTELLAYHRVIHETAKQAKEREKRYTRKQIGNMKRAREQKYGKNIRETG